MTSQLLWVELEEQENGPIGVRRGIDRSAREGIKSMQFTPRPRHPFWLLRGIRSTLIILVMQLSIMLIFPFVAAVAVKAMPTSQHDAVRLSP